jgi:hypothetical protein
VEEMYSTDVEAAEVSNKNKHKWEEKRTQ